MKRFAKQAVFSLGRVIESYDGPICTIEAAYLGGQIDCYSTDEVIEAIENNATVLPVYVAALFNQSFVDDSFVAKTVDLSNVEVVLVNGVPAMVDPDFTVDLGDEIEHIWAVVGAEFGQSPEVLKLGENSYPFKLGVTCAAHAYFDTEEEFDPYCSVNNMVPVVLRGSADKTELLTHERSDRPELNTTTDATSYSRVNGRFIRVADTTILAGSHVDVGAGTTGALVTEIVLTTRALEIQVSLAYEQEAAKRFGLYYASEKTGIAGDIERATNREFEPISWWEGSDGIAGETGPLDNGVIANGARDHWSVINNGTVVQTPAGYDAVKIDATQDSIDLEGVWDNTANPVNYNTVSDDGFTVLTFSRILSIPPEVSGSIRNHSIFHKDRLTFNVRETGSDSEVMKYRGAVRSTNGSDVSISGRFEVKTNAWQTGGVVYSSRDAAYKVGSGAHDLVTSGEITYDPDVGDTKVRIGSNSGGTRKADMEIAAFMFLPYPIPPRLYRKIGLFWQRKYGSGISESDLTAHIDDTGFILGNAAATDYNALQFKRKDITDFAKFSMIPDGLFSLQNGNEIVSFKCHITGQELQIVSDPPATLKVDAKLGCRKVVIPTQASGLPAYITALTPDSPARLYVHVTARDVLNGEATTYFKLLGENAGEEVHAHRPAEDFNTKIDVLPSESGTSFPQSASAYRTLTTSATGLLDLYAHPLLNRSLSRYWSRCTSNYSLGGAIGRNKDWEERDIGRLIIENQRWARDCAIAGLLGLPLDSQTEGAVDETGHYFENGYDNVRRSLRFINWGWQFQVTDTEDENYGGFDSGDILHSSSFFLEAAANILQCITESDATKGTSWLDFNEGIHGVTPRQWLPKLQILAEWLGNKDIWNPEDDPSIYADSLEPFTHRFFLRGWGIWLVGHLLDDDGIKTSGETLLQLGIDKQTSNGVNPERWAKDTSYQCVGCALLGQYYTLSDNDAFKAQIPDFIRNAMKSAEEEFNLVTGEVEFEGYRALTETARAGGRKTFDMRFYAYACLVADSVCGTTEFSEVGARVISYSGRYHDLTTIGYDADGTTGALLIDGYNESDAVIHSPLGSTLTIQLGNGANVLEVFDIIALSSDDANPIFEDAGVRTAVGKIPARRYDQPVNDPDEGDPLFNDDETIPQT